MRWLLLRGLAREQRHYIDFPKLLEKALPGHATTGIDLAGFGTENERPSPLSIAGIVDDVRARFLADHRQRAPGGPWSIFGISLGGMVALDWVARFPEDFERGVIANASAANLSPPWERFALSVSAKLPRFLTSSTLARERAILDVISNRPAADKDDIAKVWAVYARERPARRASFGRQLVAAARSRAPSEVSRPLLFLASRGDRLVSWRCSEKLSTRLRAPLELHDSGGHDITLDDPDWVCARIAAWIAR